MAFVVDASMTMAWCFEDEASPRSEAVLDRLHGETAIVPSIWPLEVANVLIVGQRRGRLTAAQSTRFVEAIDRLPIDVEMRTLIIGDIVHSGIANELSAYDAAYLSLAARLGLPLATLDRRLADAARAAGVSVL